MKDIIPKTIINAELPDEMVQIFEKVNEEDKKLYASFPPVDYEYEDFSLSEVAVLAKEDSEAREEFLNRIMTLLEKYAFYIRDNNFFLDYSSVLSLLMKTANRTINIYDPSTELPIDNLLRKGLKTHYLWYMKSEAARYYKELATMGKRIQINELSFYDSVAYEDDMKDEIIHRIDMENFEKSLTALDKEMLDLYRLDYPFRQIASMLNLAPSTVSYRIYRMMKKFSNRTKKER